jgi:hypothetical protein
MPAAHPSATADGTDCVQASRPALEAKLSFYTCVSYGTIRINQLSHLDTVSTVRGSGWVRSLWICLERVSTTSR